MHALLIKTEWRSCSSAMDTCWGMLLRALDKWYLLVQANSSWDPHLSMGVISDPSGNVRSWRGCRSPDQHCCLHRHGQLIHYRSPLADGDRAGQQRKLDTDDKDKSVPYTCLQATGRCNLHLRRCEDGWRAEKCVSWKKKKDKHQK